MKTYLIIGLLITFLFSHCSSDKALSPKLNYEQASVELMNELQPTLTGRWTLRKVDLTYQHYNGSQKQLNITKDTSFANLATLTIAPTTVPRSSPRDLRRGEYDGAIQFGSKTYPIQFDLLAGSGWIYEQKGPQAYFLFSYKFPVGTHVPEAEERFLEDIGLINDNYSLELTADSGKMVWRGLNRGLTRIELIKN